MNDKINSTINVLPPFKHLCMTIGELPASYLETMSYYETLIWFTKYLKETVIPTVNNNAEAVSELQELFVKLQNYVNNYFDNLDVQEEINNKLDEMVEDGTFQEIINNFINVINYIRVSDYYEENSYINLQTLYNTAKTNKKAIYIDGTFKVNGTMVCDEYIEIYGGKLIADSYETTSETLIPKDIIELQNGGYIHDIEFESVADQIPYINKRVSENYGYASNINAIKCSSNNCNIERIKTKFMTGIWVLGSSGNEIKNINIDKCLFDYAEMGVYGQLASFTLTNTNIFMSEDVQSIYYHPIYAIILNNCNFSNLNIKTNELVNQTVELTSYFINDVFHIYNPSAETDTFSQNINISNINIDGHFNILSQAYWNKSIKYNNIRGKFERGIFVLRKQIQEINVSNSNFSLNTTNTRVIDFTEEFNSSDSITFNNCEFVFNNNCSQIIGSCNITFKSCKFIRLATGGMTLPYDNSICDGYLNLIDCYFKLPSYSAFYLGTGSILYQNCYFENTYMAPTGDTGIDENSKCKVINCYFEALRNLWDTQYQSKDLFFSAYGWDTNTEKQKYITSITN